MDDGVELAPVKPAEQVARRDHVRELPLGKFAPFAAGPRPPGGLDSPSGPGYRLRSGRQEMNQNSNVEAQLESPILIVPYMWIGDFVRCHTVIKLLRQPHPRSDIDVLST